MGVHGPWEGTSPSVLFCGLLPTARHVEAEVCVGPRSGGSSVPSCFLSWAVPFLVGNMPCLSCLQAVGLPLEEALVFWRTEFAPRVPADKFEKEYAYNIRHNYGAWFLTAGGGC